MSPTYKPKILIVPAWYPATFFIEQMELVEDTFDFKVLVGERIEYGKKKALKQIIRGKLKRFTWESAQIQNETHQVIKVSYPWINNLPRFLELKQYGFLNYFFDKQMKELKKSGFQPDLIHIQSLSDTSVFICNWAEKNQVPVILTEHIIYIRRKFDFFQREKEKVYSRVKKVLCVSNYVYRNLLTSCFQMKDVGIVGNLVDDRYVPVSFEKKMDATNILFVASHLADKDIHILFNAVRILVDSGFTDFKVEIIGLDPEMIFSTDSDSKLTLKESIKKYGLHNFVECKGQLTKYALLQTYKYYSFLVSTSLSETFGLAVVEALINGLPVVCTDSGGIRDFVDKSNGIIVPIRDPQAISDGIIRMLKEIDHYNPNQISHDIAEKYGRTAFAKRIINEYFHQIIVYG